MENNTENNMDYLLGKDSGKMIKTGVISVDDKSDARFISPENEVEIFERFYDNPLKEDGTEKRNKSLGKYSIIETLFEDGYSSLKIGEKNGEIYLIKESEVSFVNSGSRFEVTKLESVVKK